jgi:hypothetical protein
MRKHIMNSWISIEETSEIFYYDKIYRLNESTYLPTTLLPIPVKISGFPSLSMF